MIMSIIALRYKNYLELIPWEEEIIGNVAETAVCQNFKGERWLTQFLLKMNEAISHDW